MLPAPARAYPGPEATCACATSAGRPGRQGRYGAGTLARVAEPPVPRRQVQAGRAGERTRSISFLACGNEILHLKEYS
jgi:hypothetical protein